MRRLVLITPATETFAPIGGGPTARFFWDLCRAAAADGCKPLVISSKGAHPTFDWPHLKLVDVPRPGAASGVRARILRRLGRIRHLEEPAYLAEVTAAISDAGATRDILMMQDSPELAIGLRRRLPEARLAHLFQGQLEASPWVRRHFAGAADLVAAVSAYAAGWTAVRYRLARVSVMPEGTWEAWRGALERL